MAFRRAQRRSSQSSATEFETPVRRPSLTGAAIFGNIQSLSEEVLLPKAFLRKDELIPSRNVRGEVE
jgi:hypothetical protein